MGWLKVAVFAVGALIVFMVLGTVVHLFFDLLIAALVIGGIAAAIKFAAGRRRLQRGRRDYRDYELRTPPRETATAGPTAHTTGNVDDDLARLKREMRG